MVHLPQMHKFMQDDIVPYKHWRLDEPPVQRNGSATRAGSPTRPLIANGDSTHTQAEPLRQLKDGLRKLPHRQIPKVQFDGGPKVGVDPFQTDLFSPELNGGRLFSGDNLDSNQNPSKIYFVPGKPFPRRFRTGSQSPPRFFEPGEIPFGELSRLRKVPSSRHGDTHCSICPEPEPFAAPCTAPWKTRSATV